MIKRRGSKWQVDVTHQRRRVRRNADSLHEAKHLEKIIELALLEGRPLPSEDRRGPVSGPTMELLKARTVAACWQDLAYEVEASRNAQQAVDFFGSGTDPRTSPGTACRTG